MKKLFLLFSMFAFVFCLGLSTASAIGVGFSASTGSSTVDWTQGTSAFSTDSDHTGFGFSMDTNLSRERMFNYRVELSKSDLTFKNFNGPLGPGDLELDGIVLTNDFGFGARLSPLVKLWFGPELKFMWVDGTLSTDPTYNVDIFGAGLGAAVGINFNLPGPVTLAAKLAYVMMNYDDNDLFTSLEGEENLTYLTFTVFFRSAGDR